MLSRKLIIPIIALFAVSCVSTNGIDIVQLKKVDSSASKVYIADIGNGIKTGATITVNLNSNTFKTKASSNGVLAKTENDIKSYQISLCTNSTQPIMTQVSGSSFNINRDGSTLTAPHTITFVNVPSNASPYYAVVKAFDAVSAGGNSMIKPDNGSMTPYASSDAGQEVAVSTNSVLVGTDLTLTFAPVTPNYLAVTANLKDGIGAHVETQITPVDGIIDEDADSIPDLFTVQ